MPNDVYEVRQVSFRTAAGDNVNTITVPDNEFWIIRHIGITVNITVPKITNANVTLDLGNTKSLTLFNYQTVNAHNWYYHAATYPLPPGTKINFVYNSEVAAAYAAIRYYVQVHTLEPIPPTE